MQEVKAVHDKVRNGHNIQLPDILANSHNTGPKQGSISVPNRLRGGALEEHVAPLPKNVHVTIRAVAQSPSTAMAPTQDIWETVSPHPETQERMQRALRGCCACNQLYEDFLWIFQGREAAPTS